MRWIWLLRRKLEELGWVKSKDTEFDERYVLTEEVYGNEADNENLKIRKVKKEPRFGLPVKIVGTFIIACFMFTVLVGVTIGKDVDVMIEVNDPLSGKSVVRQERGLGNLKWFKKDDNVLSSGKNSPIEQTTKDILGEEYVTLPET